MKDVAKVIKEIDGSAKITSEEICRKMLDNSPVYLEQNYTPTGYKGHHHVVVSKNIKDFMSGVIEGSEREYLGLTPYLGKLSNDLKVFENDFSATRNALKTTLIQENNYSSIRQYVGSFSSASNTAIKELTEKDNLTIGNFFYLHNSLKNIREEYIDDFI